MWRKGSSKCPHRREFHPLPTGKIWSPASGTSTVNGLVATRTAARDPCAQAGGQGTAHEGEASRQAGRQANKRKSRQASGQAGRQASAVPLTDRYAEKPTSTSTRNRPTRLFMGARGWVCPGAGSQTDTNSKANVQRHGNDTAICHARGLLPLLRGIGRGSLLHALRALSVLVIRPFCTPSALSRHAARHKDSAHVNDAGARVNDMGTHVNDTGTHVNDTGQ
mgnify:CR=1 FL=1